MTDLPYWGIAAIQIWICTRDLSFVQKRLTGDARQDEEHVALEVATHKIGLPSSECDLSEVYHYEKRSVVVSKEQAIEELLTKLRFGELKALGVKCDPKNGGNPVSDTAEDIPTCDWAYFRFRPFPPGLEGRYAAFYEDNKFPSWRHVVCSGVTVRQLWPQDQTETAEAAQASQPIPAPARKRRVSQQSVAEEVGREIFPYGVPASMTTRQISAAIEQKLKTDHLPLAKEISSTTLARVARSLPKASV